MLQGVTTLHVVSIIIAYPADGIDSKSFEIWEFKLRFKADGLRDAMMTALSRARALFDDADNLRRLGYYCKPTLYGVRSVTADGSFPQDKAEFELLEWIGPFDERQMEMLKSHEGVPIRLRVFHLGNCIA